MSEMEPIRFVKVAEAREQLKNANSLIRYLAKYARPLDKHRKQDVDAWLRKLPSVMEGLPQTFELDDQICYRAPDGAVVDGVIVATVTCHEQYVVAPGDSRATAGRQPGDSRATKGEPMYMVCPSMIVKRGETPPLPGKRHETPNS
jgi:hypothetical protein